MSLLSSQLYGSLKIWLVIYWFCYKLVSNLWYFDALFDFFSAMIWVSSQVEVLGKQCPLAVTVEYKVTSVFESTPFMFLSPQPENFCSVLQRLGPLSRSSLQWRSSALQLWQVRLYRDQLWSGWRTVSLQAACHRSTVHKVCHGILRLPLLQTWVNVYFHSLTCS